MEAIGRAGGEARGRSRARLAQLRANGFQERETAVAVSREGMPGSAPQREQGLRREQIETGAR
jgi:hypothetical protein